MCLCFSFYFSRDRAPSHSHSLKDYARDTNNEIRRGVSEGGSERKVYSLKNCPRPSRSDRALCTRAGERGREGERNRGGQGDRESEREEEKERKRKVEKERRRDRETERRREGKKERRRDGGKEIGREGEKERKREGGKELSLIHI